MFLVRAVFWLALVVAFIPANPADLKDGHRSVSTAETVGLAQSVMNDLGSFCERNSNTCETGGVLISQMGIKAKEGARIAYSWLDANYGTNNSIAASKIIENPALDPVSTSSIKKQD